MKTFLNKSLLITRPLEDGLAFSKQIQKLNSSINTICAPLFEIESLSLQKDLSEFTAIIVTSSNAIRSLTQSRVKYEGPVFCVGRATALLAKKAGFFPITSIGNTNNLYDLIRNLMPVGPEKLLYFRGEEIVGDLGNLLRKKNYNVIEEICYKKTPKKFSKKIVDSIGTKSIVGSTFFSKQTVKMFFNNVQCIPDGFAGFCISEDVSKTLLSLYPEISLTLRIAKEPSMEEMCKLVVAAPEFAG